MTNALLYESNDGGDDGEQQQQRRPSGSIPLPRDAFTDCWFGRLFISFAIGAGQTLVAGVIGSG